MDNINSAKNIHYRSVETRMGNRDGLLLVFMPLNFSGLQIIGFRCNAIAAGCLSLDESICAGGLPMNFLLLVTLGVVSAVVFNSGSGENNLE